MVRKHIKQILPRLTKLAVILLLILVSCDSSGTILPTPTANPQVEPVLSEQEPNVAIPAAHQVLTLTTPAIVTLDAGQEFEVQLGAALAAEVHQGSVRLLFDPEQMQPVSYELGELLPAGMLTVVGLDQRGYVPFAFTALPDDQGIVPGEGKLLTVRFRLNRQPEGNPRVRLQNEPEFLQLRNREGQRLGFELASKGEVQ